MTDCATPVGRRRIVPAADPRPPISATLSCTGPLCRVCWRVSGADLSGADPHGCNLRHALIRATRLDQARLDGARLPLLPGPPGPLRIAPDRGPGMDRDAGPDGGTGIGWEAG
jgi:hypothetical protein